jgi:hypothetical protein
MDFLQTKKISCGYPGFMLPRTFIVALTSFLMVSCTNSTPIKTLSTAVMAYADADFKGQQQSFGPGIYQSDQGQLDQVGNDTISSLYIPENLMVRTCVNPDGSGSCWTFRAGRHSSIGSPLNDSISRIEVLKSSNNFANGQAVRDALANGGVIELPTDTYRFDAPLEITKSGTKLNANGSTFVFTNRFDHAVEVMPTEGVTLENFAIDYDPLPFTQGRVEALSGDSYDVRVDAGYPTDPQLFLVPGAQAPLGYGQKPGIALIDPQTKQFKQEGAKTWANSLTAPAAGMLRVGVPPQDVNVQVGDLVAILAPWWNCAVMIWNSGQVTVRNVQLWSAPGGGVCQNGGEGGTNFDNLRIIPGPMPTGATQQRLLAVNRDGVHIKFVRRGAVLQNSTIDSISDDGFNNESLIAKVTALNGQTITLSDAWVTDFTQVNDQVRVYDSALRIRVTATVSSKSDVNDTLTLDNAAGIQAGDRVVNISRMGEGTVIRNNTFRNIEARGILARGSGTRITGNTIDRTTISGIWVGPEIGFYSEGDFARDVIIENNTLRNIGYSWRSRGSPTIGAINVLTGFDEAALVQSTAGHRQNENITIRGNTIESSAMAGIFVSDAVNVKVCDNKVGGSNSLSTASGGALYGLTADKALIVRDSANVQFAGNQVTAPGTHSTGERLIDQTAQNVAFDTPDAVQACAK